MKKKIWITIFLIIIFTSVITSIVSISFEKSKYFDDIETKIHSTEELLKYTLDSKDRWDEDELNRLAKYYSELLGCHVSILLQDGNIISSNKYISSYQDDEELLYINKIPIENKHIIELNISVYNEDLSSINKQFGGRFFTSLLISITMGLFIGVRYIEYAEKPYKELTKATQNIINGNYEEKVVFYDDKELEYLAKNFNYMSYKLKNTISQLQEANTKLKSTLISIGDGVIAFDNDLKTILINPCAENILGLEETEVMGKDIGEVIKDKKLKEMFLDLIDLGTPKEIELTFKSSDDKVLNIYANPIIFHKNSARRLGTVFIIQDITKIKKLERVREDFVANVSHELKTPLTSIKGFIETLKEGAIKDKGKAFKFLNIIDEEVNRLNRLLEDLLLLSEVENKELDMLSELIYVEEVVDEVFHMLSGEAEEKDIVLEKEIIGGIFPIQGNYNYFKQMLINLVDNGIKYNSMGGYVKVSIEVKKGYMLLKVMDNGLGIDKEEQDRIFERFYRVDKSRSRDIGGTGLGLAIVKHVVSVFNGSIHVESQLNKGSKFLIKIPINSAI